jgi:Na+-translocating ferredoxin:NAD+ oxidoreductase RnfD subunit
VSERNGFEEVYFYGVAIYGTMILAMAVSVFIVLDWTMIASRKREHTEQSNDASNQRC